jgi:AcrR family transcriptional regulator
MSGAASTLASAARNNSPRSRAEAKRARIIEVAMKHFAEYGYEAARVGDMADELGIAKGSIFQHFGSKDGLFFDVYKKAARSFSAYLNVPS